MSGIYIHIPFCKQACHYCDFHFSTSLRQKDALLEALHTEAEMQQGFFSGLLPVGKQLDTLYFGGGTPSLLTTDELRRLLDTLRQHYPVSSTAEITLEANPDDLTKEKVKGLVDAGINRLSIGIQSFRDSDLKYMNRVHTASEADASVKRAQDAGIHNISIDLIYGVPGLDGEGWKQNLQHAFSLDVPHLSCYALTVEANTALSHFIRSGKFVGPEDSQAEAHFRMLIEKTGKAGYVHYEISNFAKEGFHSRHNSSYWNGEPYLGLGPSAHSYNLLSRRWNVRNNPGYIRSLAKGKIPFEEETLTPQQRFNEFVMISLRTSQGLILERAKEFGSEFPGHLKKLLATTNPEWVEQTDRHVRLTTEGMLFADRIASDLFI